MSEQWRYRGRTVTAEDIVFIRDLIARHPGLSRRKLPKRAHPTIGQRVNLMILRRVVLERQRCESAIKKVCTRGFPSVKIRQKRGRLRKSPGKVFC